MKSFQKRFLLLFAVFVPYVLSWGYEAKSELKEKLNNHFLFLLKETRSDYRLDYFFAVTNDTCDQAQVIPVSSGFDCDDTTTTPVDLTGSTASGKGKPSCDTTAGTTITNMRDQWFTFTATANVHTMSISNISGGTETVRGVLYNYQTKGTSPVPVECDVNLGGSSSVWNCNISFSNTNTKVRFEGLVPGKNYILRLYTQGASTKKFDMCIYTPPSHIITSNVGELYTVEELVSEVLVNASCNLVSNIRYQYGDGSPATKKVKGVGYFNRNNADFAFDEGVVLGTGEVSYLGRHYAEDNDRGWDHSNLSWAGDKDIKDLIEDSGGKPENANNDPRVSQLEFDFIPVQETVSFEYLFGSNSYVQGCTHTCNNGAMFGAWLIDTVTGDGENLAKIPGTTLPIAMGTVKDYGKMGFPAQCPGAVDLNPHMFDRCWATGAPGAVVAGESPVDLAAITIAAKSVDVKVVPGRKYHIKLVVLDFCANEMHTSAAFFKGGSFDIGNPVLGTDMSLDAGTAACPGETVVLGADLNPDHYLIQWTKDGKDLVGENGAQLKVKEPGLYGAKLNYKDVECEIEPQSVLVEYYDEIIIENEPSALEVCKSGEATTIVNLDKAMDGVTHSDVRFSYHESKTDAEQEDGSFIDSNYQMDSSLSVKQIWVRIQRNDGPCYEVRSFAIRLVSCTIALVDLPNMEVCQNSDPNDFVRFDLTQYDDVVYYGRPGYNVSYHTSETAARSGTDAIGSAEASSYEGASGDIIWVRVEDASNPGTFSVTSFKLIIHPLPKVNPKVTPLIACLSSSSSTQGDFVLREKDNEITMSSSSLEVSYYATLSDAQAGDLSKSLNKDSYLSGAKEIYYRVESLRSGCWVTGSFVLALSPSFELGGLNTYFQCSETGYAVFNLESIAGDKTKGNTVALSYKYYRTLSDAELGKNPLVLTSGKYTNSLHGSERIFIRVDNKQGCFKIEPIDLVVEQAPSTNTPSPIKVCATDSNSAIIVDLTQKESEIVAGGDPSLYLIRYYTSYLQAQEGKLSSSIKDPVHYSNAMGNQIYVRVESRLTSCFSVETIKIESIALPSIPSALPDLSICDTASQTGIGVFKLSDMRPIISETNSYEISFYKSLSEAHSGSNALNDTSYTNETPYSQVIYTRVVDLSTGCYVVSEFFLRVNKYPPYDLSKGGVISSCTSSNSGQGEFNLVAVAQQSIVNHSDYNFWFYENLGDAELDQHRVRNPESYVNQEKDTSQVWIRIEDKKTKCIGIYQIELVVFRAPVLPIDLAEVVLCDDFGNRFDGLVQVDLTLYESTIKNSLTGGHAGVVTYYRSESDAKTNSNRIADPVNYHTQANPETIWYRLTDSVTGCYAIEHYKIRVNFDPRLDRPEAIIQCSDLSIGQNKAVFDLSANLLTIIGGSPIYGLEYAYYESESDALSGTNSIASSDVTKYVNKSTSQDIWIVITNEEGCRSMVVQKITAEAMPEPNMTPSALESCELEFGKGEGVFNLTNSERDIRQGDTGLKLLYYKTKAGALAGAGSDDTGTGVEKPLVDKDFTEYKSKTGKVYVRVSNMGSTKEVPCYVIVELSLIVHSKPYINAVRPYVICMDTPTTRQKFDLSSKNSEILSGRASSDYRITYHRTLNEAKDNKGALVSPYTNEVDTKQEIFVRLEDLTTGCYHTSPLLLQIEQAVYAHELVTEANLEMLVKCSNLNNPKTAIFDFTKFGEDIMGGQTGVEVVYYLNETEYEAGNPITPINKIELAVGKYTIIAVVKSTAKDTYCKAEYRFDIEVLESPTPPKMATGAIVCVDYSTGKLIDPYTIDSGFDPALYDFQWQTRKGGTITDIKGATKSYYVVEDNSNDGGVYRLRINFKGSTCMSYSMDVKLNYVEEIPIRVKGADSKGVIGALDGEERISIEIESPTESSIFEYALDEGAYQDSRIFYDVMNGTHRVWVRYKDDKSICPQYMDVFILGYPKFFTPNGDGINDTWNIPTLKGHPEAVIYIYDRYGKLLTQLSPSKEGWDGTFSGKAMPSTDYWFTVEYLEEAGESNKVARKVQFKGHFSLKR